MTTETLSKETEQKILDFFNKTMDPSSFAKVIRQLNYVIALSIIRDDENGTIYSQKENLDKGFYWLNEFAEILNPYLELK